MKILRGMVFSIHEGYKTIEVLNELEIDEKCTKEDYKNWFGYIRSNRHWLGKGANRTNEDVELVIEVLDTEYYPGMNGENKYNKRREEIINAAHEKYLRLVDIAYRSQK